MNRIRKKSRWIYAILVVILITSFGLNKNASASDTPDITLGDAGWDSVRLHNAVFKYIVENLYGKSVESLPGSTPVLQTALINGDIDINMEVWEENVATYDQDLATGKIVEAGVNFDDNKQGFYVPKYVIYGDEERGIEPAAPDLKYVKDLEKYAHVFVDEEDKTKGRIYGAIPGWAIDEVMYKKFLYYGFDKDYNYFRPGSDSALSAAFEAAYNKGEPIVGYYWEPTWLKSKLELVRLEDEPYDPEGFEQGKTEAPPVTVTKLVNKEFAEKNPEIIAFLENYSTTSDSISDALNYMQEHNATYEDTAIWFLKNNDYFIQEWFDEEDQEKVIEVLETADNGSEAEESFPVTIDIDYDQIDNLFRRFTEDRDGFLELIKVSLTAVVDVLEGFLLAMPWWLVLGILFLLGLILNKSVIKGTIYAVAFFLVGLAGLWDLMMVTLALIIISVIVSVFLGFLIGLFMKSFNLANIIIKPILDLMQTLPSFVYLIPAIMFFGLGKVPAVISTVIYSIVPMIRLTNLGLRNVDKTTIESGKAFGATKLQMLVKIEIPQALPSIRTGINQTIMMAVSMVVICSMVGAAGLGMEVLIAVNRTEIGRGLVSGLAIVALAMVFDSLTGFSKNGKG